MDVLPDLGQDVLRQFGLNHDISSLGARQETGPGTIGCVEDLGVFEFGLVGYRPFDLPVETMLMTTKPDN